ncbi:PPOX class F420-dependent oxidoreductase [Nocardia sp. 2]|uniref:PPOX class F420-dependent oxidoreductase n=1 Tax=Nocardia acididurans TaxID=2802282 RepID=A0ABS1M8C3_9NOCA|nr:PPOX class F420-dependent oxidoreductase [Nocardia acididurans]MBL1076892.1 PPOX class F420-dependent oxidoreductase [Nocardia acididurans]
MTFTETEIGYLRSQPLARLATHTAAGQPDVVPVAFEFDGTYFWVGGNATFPRTRKARNVAAGNTEVALTIDDLPSLDPFIARGIRVYGRAEPPIERTGIVGPGYYLRITPVQSWSWNLAGEPAGDQWYDTRHTWHRQL